MSARAARWVGLAVALRLLLALTPGYAFDLRLFRSWGRALATQPWATFYTSADGADHLPGDIVVHGLLARGCTALGVGVDSPGYAYALKLVPAVGDIALAGALWVLAGRRGALAGLFSPALLYVSGVWGQWDSMSLALAVWGLVLVWRSSRWMPLAGCLFAWAVLVKPPLAVPIALGCLVVWSRRRPDPMTIALSALLGVGTAQLLCLPFGLVLADLPGRVRYAADLWPVTTMGAPNLWMAVHGSPWGPPRDDAVQWVGVLLLCLALAVVGAQVWRHRRADPVALACWAAAVGSYATFALLTRAHERYAMPGVVLLGLLWALTGRGRATWAAATALLLASALAANLLPAQPFSNPVLRVVPFEIMSLGTLAVLGVLLVTPPAARR